MRRVCCAARRADSTDPMLVSLLLIEEVPHNQPDANTERFGQGLGRQRPAFLLSAVDLGTTGIKDSSNTRVSLRSGSLKICPIPGPAAQAQLLLWRATSPHPFTFANGGGGRL